eukprot:CAMPEP_0185027260 /NCGR_PEP_ID=MMETSP1103-20130426/12068_1 /TAXON_ID=36769 /ORGANISM="Paraphysomonas bandaiensis, Strain Caron Lab Isolate" /LENGTH=503 /DNA_ID=CAMNT_0027561161 /DNA_START=336 /DNA_END=1847 /DNA_ORIENTATION=-
MSDFCTEFVDSIISVGRIKKVACMIVGVSSQKNLIEEVGILLRDPHCSKEAVDNTLNPDVIRIPNSSKLFCNLDSQFKSGKTVSLRLNRQRATVLSIRSILAKRWKKKRKGAKPAPGMIIFVDPGANTNSDRLILNVKYDTREGRSREDAIALWSDGNVYGMELTDNSTPVIPRDLESEQPRRSLPGWNGRLPIWVPGYQAELRLCSPGGLPCNSALTSLTARESAHSTAQLDSFANSSDTDPATPCPPSRDNPACPLEPVFFTPSAPVTPALSHIGSVVASQQDCRVTVKGYSCPSLEVGMQKISELSLTSKKRAIANMTLPGKMPALNLASLHGNIKAVKRILDCGGDPNKVCGSTGCTPLHEAITSNSLDVISLLLDHGADQTITDDRGWTPLHLACAHNEVAAARILMKSPQIVDVLRKKDRLGRTPNHVCSKQQMKGSIEACMKVHKIPVKKAAWWNNLSRTIVERVDGKKKEHKDAIKQYVINARMNNKPPRDSDYY